MNAEKMGAMIARAAGLILIIMGASTLLYLLPWFATPGMATAGWTSYSPPLASPSQSLMTHLHDTYYVVASTAGFYVPSIGQTFAGIIMILLSRPIGRWLARGLNATKSYENE